MAAKGITFDLDVTQIEQGVVSGGKSETWEYECQIEELGITFTVGKLVHVAMRDGLELADHQANVM